MLTLVDRLLSSEEPAIQLKVRLNLLGTNPLSDEIRDLPAAVAACPRVITLLSQRGPDGRIPCHPYTKWVGAHWTLATLADLGYPPGDETLLPLVHQVTEWLFSERHAEHIRAIDGRTRRCTSQEGNALYAIQALGLTMNGEVDDLASRLMRWQWPDGGWNCDKRPEAFHSSFMESLIPLRGLALYAHRTGHRDAHEAVKRAAEVFLRHHLYKRLADGQPIAADFVKLFYPPYWHYDILFALKVLAEAGFIHDERCCDALDLLEAHRLPDGGFPADKAYYRVAETPISGRSLVSWGGVSSRHLNEFVTVDALSVLKWAGRL